MDEPFDSFGDWVRRRRRALDLTQAALADKVFCSAAAIRKIEAQERRPSRALAQRLAEQLDLPAPQQPAFVQAARLALADPAPAADGDAPPMVGRAGHVAALSLTLATALRGEGQVVLVQGEAGIGKSRLLQETVVTARRSGVPVVTTNCYEIERAIAYQPVIALAAQACAQLAPERLRQVPPVLLAELAELVPALALQVPGLPALSGEFPEARQARLFQALVQLFDAAAQGAGLLLAVDNVQWADDASVRFLHHYARQLRARPVLLACTLRDDEMDASADLAAAIAGLRGEAHARRLLLPRLSLADVEALLRGLQPPLPAAPGLAARLLRESEGNPFFLWSVLHAWRDAGVPLREEERTLPSDLRDSVRARLAHLPREDRALLDVAAVLGRDFDVDLLLALAQVAADALAQGLENLERRGLLRQQAEDGHYDFSHDKVREVVYGDIGAARRVLLHRQVVQFLAAQPGPGAQDTHGLLAEHCERGALWPQALHYLVQAAEHAARLFAVRQALQWFDRAVALLDAHREAGTPVLRLALHERRGALRAQAGQTEGAVADFQRAIELARATGEQRAARDALVSLGMAHRRADHYEQAVACLDEALAAARAVGDQRQVADILYHLGTVAWSNGRNDLAIHDHQEAVDLCERLGLQDLVAVQAFHGRGEAALAEGRPLAAIDCFTRSLALARALGDRGYEAENLLMLGWSRVDGFGTGDAQAALADFDAALATTRAADLSWHLAPALIGRAQAQATLGRTLQAWDDLHEALQSAASLGLLRYQLMAHDLMGELHLRAGQLRDAAREFERALLLAGGAGIRYWVPRVQAGLALARLRDGAEVDVAALRAGLQQARVHREAWLFPRCLQALAEAALRQGDAATAAAYADDLAGCAAAGGLQALAAEAKRLHALAGSRRRA